MAAPPTAREDSEVAPKAWRFLQGLRAWLVRESPLVSVVVLGTVVLLVHAYRYMPFFADDSFISMRYAERLLEGEGLTWTDGERVEGYSNLLWVLALAAVSAFGVDMLDGARALGVACFVVCMAAIALSCHPKSFADRKFWAAAVGVTSMALTGTVAVWAIAGLEQPLLAALVTSGIVLTLKNLRERDAGAHGDTVRADLRAWLAPAICFGLASWTRPDGPLFAGVIAGLLFVVPTPYRGLRRGALVIAAITGAFVAAQLAFRLAYYGEWVPNTARAKIAWSTQRLHEGFDHVVAGYTGLWPLVLLTLSGLPAIFKDARVRLHVLLPLGSAAVWSLYVLVVGGDFFAAWRHFVPAVALLALAVTQSLSYWAERLERKFWWALGSSVALLGALLTMQLRDEGVKNAIYERWEWQAPPIGALLRRQFGEQAPLFAVDSAGCLPWFSKLPSLDMLGLNDYYLAHNPPPDMGTHDLGHELGNGYYVLSRKPDIVLFGIPSDHGRPKFRGGFEMFNTPVFRDSYDRVIFQAGPRGLFYRTWMRRDSAKVGIDRTPTTVTIPGYFFATNDETPAVEDADGKLAVRLSPGHPATQRVRLPEGTWQAHTESIGAEVRLRLTASGITVRRLRLTLDRPVEVTARISVGRGDDAFVRSVHFERIPPQAQRSTRRN